MKTAFIIAEYNPFHNGHRRHIGETRRLQGAERVVAVMSGNYVQRGETAVCDKMLRAEAAVRCGADLVLELSVKYAVSNAGRFARGAAAVIAACGMEAAVSFGASAPLEELENLAALLADPVLSEEARAVSRERGKTYPAAVDLLLRQKGFAREADLLHDPNNVLAVEYLKQLASYDTLCPFAVRRSLSQSHVAAEPDGDIASAGYIRRLIDEEYRQDRALSCPFRFSRYLPAECVPLLEEAVRAGRFPADRALFAAAAFSRLLLLTREGFAALDNVNQGLENKIVRAIRDSASVEEAVLAVKSKRFTMARLRQIMLAGVLGVTKEDASSVPSYLRVLAFNETGRGLLAELRETARLPVVTNLSDVKNDPACRRDAELEYHADKLYDACLPVPRGGNRPYREHPVYVRD